MLIGVDWGGTKIEAVALSREGELLEKRRVATPQGDYGGCIEALAGLVHGIEANLGRKGSVGVGIPGAISPATGLVMNANSTWNNGQRLDDDLARALGREVRIENDANCFAVSEAIDGAGRDGRVVLGVILGTGVGAGIAIDGVALGGRNRIAGEFGHNPLPWPKDDERPGPACFCGRAGCIETFVSGTGFARDHNARTGGSLRAEEIVVAMREGDTVAAESFGRYRDRLARALAHVVNVLDPDVIVLGGGMSNVDELHDGLAGLVEPWVFSDAFVTPVVRHRHGDSSGVRGAAWLWKT
jgi:fructokinase